MNFKINLIIIFSLFSFSLVAQDYDTNFEWVSSGIVFSQTETVPLTRSTPCGTRTNRQRYTVEIDHGFRRYTGTNSDYPNPSIEFGGNLGAPLEDITVTISFVHPVENLSICIADLDFLPDGRQEILKQFSITPASVDGGLLWNNAQNIVCTDEADQDGCIYWDEEITSISFVYDRESIGFSMFLSGMSFDCIKPNCSPERVETTFDWVSHNIQTTDNVTLPGCNGTTLTLTVTPTGFRQNSDPNYSVPAAEFGGNLGAPLEDIAVLLQFSPAVANPSLSVEDIDYITASKQETLIDFNVPPHPLPITTGLSYDESDNVLRAVAENKSGTLSWSGKGLMDEISFTYRRTTSQGFSMFLNKLVFDCSCGGLSKNLTSDHSFDHAKLNVLKANAPIKQESESSLNEQKEISIFPNPSTGKYTLSLSNLEHLRDNISVFVTDDLGRKVYAENLSNTVLDISHLPAGLYHCHILHEDAIIASETLLKID